MRILSLFLMTTLLITGCANMKPADFNFNSLVRTDKPNSYLVCPKNYCHTRVDAEALEYKASAASLIAAWKEMIAAQPRTTLLASNPQQLTFQYVQYSRFFHFPDYIEVQFIPLTDHTCTLAIYSHAVYGYYDFHVNENRVKTWLKAINRQYPAS
jgi:uncharacterized protein (DUF1499 family)